MVEYQQRFPIDRLEQQSNSGIAFGDQGLTLADWFTAGQTHTILRHSSCFYPEAYACIGHRSLLFLKVICNQLDRLCMVEQKIIGVTVCDISLSSLLLQVLQGYRWAASSYCILGRSSALDLSNGSIAVLSASFSETVFNWYTTNTHIYIYTLYTVYTVYTYRYELKQLGLCLFSLVLKRTGPDAHGQCDLLCTLVMQH